MTAGDARGLLVPERSLLIGAKVITPLSDEVSGAELGGPDSFAYSSGVWTANLALYLPMLTLEELVVAQYFWENGTVAQDHTDVGIYDDTMTTLLSHSTATVNSGVSQLQVVDITDFVLPPGRYWLSIVCDSSVTTYNRLTFGNSTLPMMSAGMKQQTSAYSSGLLGSPTPAEPSVAKVPHFGFTGLSVV